MAGPPDKTPVKLYTQRAIGISTFLGGPLAAGILIRRNLINLGRETAGLYTIIFGVLGMVAIVALVVFLPPHIYSKIPHVLIPTVYTAIIWLIVEKTHGANLRTHKAENQEFYSAWNAAGFGIASFVLMIAGILVVPDPHPPFDGKYYEDQLKKCERNETEALEFYELGEGVPVPQVQRFISDNAIPKLEQNLTIIDHLDSMENLPPELVKYNSLLRDYFARRVEIFEFTYQAFEDSTRAYDEVILTKVSEVEKLLEEIQERSR